MIGIEKFKFNDKELEFGMLEYWQFHYSNIYNLHDTIAEFIVAQALEINKAQNDQYWTLWDISYRGKRIEVKETSYYHSFNANGSISKQRIFGIRKTNGSYDFEKAGTSDFCRQNDVYVFCLNTGYDEESSYPLNLNNWEFYIVPTAFINENCGDNKTVSLGRIKSFGFLPLCYNQIKSHIDSLIDDSKI